jgi:ssDNA-binding Zn-finger/Zn-ribbon topoisomerase 1
MKADRWKKGDELKGPCHLCGGVLVVRENTRTNNLFVGCLSFPSCRMNRPLRVGDQRNTSDQEPPASATDEQDRDLTGTLCSVCERPQFRSPGGVVCEKGHGGAAGIDPDTGEVRYADEEPDSFAKHAGEPGVLVEGPDAMCDAMHRATGGSTPDPALFLSVQEMPDKGGQVIYLNKVGFPLHFSAFGLVAMVQSFVLKAWLRRRRYVGDHLDKTSCDNFREEMMRWLNFHKDREDIQDFALSYDESVWPAGEGGLHSNRLVLRVRVMKHSPGFYAFDVRLNRSLFECVSSANPMSDNFSVPYNIFDVTFEADHEGTLEDVREALKCP